jgi:cell fate (sporulation/competence/biofilm development) regulator YlbF (YheA/YmcA/DUF963 family)
MAERPCQDLFMQTTTEETLITQKTKELCQAILDQPDMQSARQAIETFIANDTAKAQYESLMAKGQSLQQKQQRSEQLSPEEISAFESDREALMNNPVARGFLDAQQELHEVHETVNQYVSKTLELGRMPTDADFESGSCGHGCGCHSEDGHSHSH